MSFDGVRRDNTEGKQFSSKLESALAQIRVDDKPYFTVVNRQQLDQVTKEMALGQSGLMDPTTGARIGQITGAQAIYTGSVIRSGSSDQPFSTKETKCSQDGKNCYDVPVHCTRRTATFVVSPKLIEVQTGKIVYSKNLTGASSAEACSGSGSPLPSASAMMEQAEQDVLRQVAFDAAPHYVSMTIELLEMTDVIESSQDKDHLANGITFAKKGRIDRACEEWAAAYTPDSKSPAITYDASLCAEISGKLDAALTGYERADRLLPPGGSSMLASIPGMKTSDPVQVLGAAMDRVKKRIRDQEQLKQQN
jgi:curli biogenesis system outer membrane secretion channel CsgG